MIMNSVLLLESHKAIEQAERMKKLTLLASFFIPLSFAAGILGMNLEQFGQGTVPYWWYIVLSIPITIVAQIIYVWNTDTVVKFWERKIRRRHRSA